MGNLTPTVMKLKDGYLLAFALRFIDVHYSYASSLRSLHMHVAHNNILEASFIYHVRLAYLLVLFKIIYTVLKPSDGGLVLVFTVVC